MENRNLYKPVFRSYINLSGNVYKQPCRNIIKDRERLTQNLTIRKLSGIFDKPITSFAYCFSNGETYIPDYEDFYLGQRETEFERITNNPESLIPSLTHEYLHQWLNENLDKSTSLALENIDKDELTQSYLISDNTKKDGDNKNEN